MEKDYLIAGLRIRMDTFGRTEKQAAPYLVLANQLICVAWFAEQEKYEELLAINKRMTLWLAAHLEALALD